MVCNYTSTQLKGLEAIFMTKPINDPASKRQSVRQTTSMFFIHGRLKGRFHPCLLQAARDLVFGTLKVRPI